MKRLLYSAAYLILFAVTIPVLWFLLVAHTWTGRATAVCGLALLYLPFTAQRSRHHENSQRLWRVLAGLQSVIVMILAAIILMRTPDGVLPNKTRLSHHFTTNTTFPRYTLTNIIPETEQINLGFRLMPYLDPILTAAQSRRVSAFTLDLYDAMEQDPDFHQVGSAMGWTYAELWGGAYDVGHYYLYVPAQAREAYPVLVFLHGSAGNFKVYTWIWSKLADELGFVVIAPSFGFGNWNAEKSAVVVQQALADARSIIPIDERQIYLAGLSNGGLGVSYTAQALPDQWRGLIFISPVMATAVTDSVAFQEQWQQRPILVITGEADRRIPLAYVTQRVTNLQTGGVHVQYVTYPNEDHFLLFSQADSVRKTVADWIEKDAN